MKIKDEIRETVYKNIDNRIEVDKKIGEFVYPTRAMKEAIVYNIKKHISKNYILLDDIKKHIHIWSDEQIEKSPHKNFARAYNQGKFDVLMEIKRLKNGDLK